MQYDVVWTTYLYNYLILWYVDTLFFDIHSMNIIKIKSQQLSIVIKLIALFIILFQLKVIFEVSTMKGICFFLRI